MNKRSLEQLLVPESKEVLKTNQPKQKAKLWGGMAQEPAERTINGQDRKNWRNKINEVVLKYNPKYNIIIWVQIDINKWLSKWIRRDNSAVQENSKSFV